MPRIEELNADDSSTPPVPHPTTDFDEVNHDFNKPVHALPPEIFVAIYNLTFHVATGDKRDTNSDYTPPVQLQVDRASRQRFATAYYGKTTFHCNDKEVMIDWLWSAEEHQCKSLGSLVYQVVTCYGELDFVKRAFLEKKYTDGVCGDLQRRSRLRMLDHLKLNHVDMLPERLTLVCAQGHGY